MARQATDGRDPRTRERILRAAASVFAEEGFGGARVDAIARRARINKAMLYYHVGDKAALYEAVILRILSGARQEIARSVEAIHSPEVKLRAVISGLATAAASSPDYPRLMLRELATGGANLPEPVMRQMAGIAGLVRDTLEQGRQEGTLRPADPLMTHLSLLGAVMALNVSAPIRRKLLSKGIEVVKGNEFTQEIPFFLGDLILGGLKKDGPRETGEKRTRKASGSEPRAANRKPKARSSE